MRDGPRSTGQSGHWLRFAQDVSRRDQHDLDQDVKLFFAVANIVVRRLHRLLGDQALLRQLAAVDAGAPLLQGAEDRRLGRPGQGRRRRCRPRSGTPTRRPPSSRRRSPATRRATHGERRGRARCSSCSPAATASARVGDPHGRRAHRGRAARPRADAGASTASRRPTCPQLQARCASKLPTFTATAEMAAHLARSWAATTSRPTTTRASKLGRDDRRRTAGRSTRPTSTARRRDPEGRSRPPSYGIGDLAAAARRGRGAACAEHGRGERVLATRTGRLVSSRSSRSRPRSSEPPPARTMPLSTMSAASSGGRALERARTRLDDLA